MVPNLPQEIYLLIAFYLDPITLVTFSQVNQALRQLLNLQRTHFIQRVLALELIEEYGGQCPRFMRSTSSIQPPFDDVKAWAKIKFACSGCLKLLSHSQFDNHRLLRRGFRKPLPGSRAHRKSQVSDWVPDYGSKRFWIEKQRIALKEKRVVDSTKYRLRKARPVPWSDDPSTLDQEESELGMLLEGTLRHNRMCNECQYQRGNFDRSTNSNHGGSYGMQIINSRHRILYEEIKRSGLLVCPPKATNPISLSRGSSEGLLPRHGSHRTLYMVRCRKCSVWKEFADFRPCGGIASAVPNPIGILHLCQLPTQPNNCCPTHESHKAELMCSRCFSELFGLQCLSKILQVWWSALKESELAAIATRSRDHWSSLDEEIYRLVRNPAPHDQIKDLIAELHAEILARTPRIPYKITKDPGVEDLHEMLMRWETILASFLTDEEIADVARELPWWEAHKYLYEHYQWILQCDAWVKENSLADYVLNDLSYRRRILYLE